MPRILSTLPESITGTPLQDLIGPAANLPSDPEDSRAAGYVCAWSDYAIWVNQVDAAAAVLDLDALTGEGTFGSNQTLSEIFQKLQDTGLDKVEGNITIAENGKPYFQVK